MRGRLNVLSIHDAGTDRRAPAQSRSVPPEWKAPWVPWDLGEEKDKEVQTFPLNRGDNKLRRCEQHF